MSESDTTEVKKDAEVAEMSLSEATAILADEGVNYVTLSNGDRCTVRKCTVKDSGLIIGLIDDTLSDITDIIGAFASERGVTTEASDFADPNSANAVAAALATAARPSVKLILQTIAKHWDKFTIVASSLTDMGEEEFNALDFDDGIKVMYKIWLVNKSFFSKRVLPLIKSLINGNA